MKPGQIFIGNIRKCTKYTIYNTLFSNEMYINNQCVECDFFGYIDTDDELYKENAILIKIKNGGYVDLENFNSILDYIKIHKSTTKNGFTTGGLIIPTTAHSLGSLFVDRKSLKPYYSDKCQKDISIRQLKKQINNNSKTK